MKFTFIYLYNVVNTYTALCVHTAQSIYYKAYSIYKPQQNIEKHKNQSYFRV